MSCLKERITPAGRLAQLRSKELDELICSLHRVADSGDISHLAFRNYVRSNPPATTSLSSRAEKLAGTVTACNRGSHTKALTAKSEKLLRFCDRTRRTGRTGRARPRSTAAAQRSSLKKQLGCSKRSDLPAQSKVDPPSNSLPDVRAKRRAAREAQDKASSRRGNAVTPAAARRMHAAVGSPLACPETLEYEREAKRRAKRLSHERKSTEQARERLRERISLQIDGALSALPIQFIASRHPELCAVREIMSSALSRVLQHFARNGRKQAWHVWKKTAHRLRKEEREAAATRIAAWCRAVWRSQLLVAHARRLVVRTERQRRHRQRRLAKQRKKACLILQLTLRRYHARQIGRRKRQERDAAKIIQRCWRDKEAQKAARVVIANWILHQKSARLIQRVTRGYFARRQVQRRLVAQFQERRLGRYAYRAERKDINFEIVGAVAIVENWWRQTPAFKRGLRRKLEHRSVCILQKSWRRHQQHRAVLARVALLVSRIAKLRRQGAARCLTRAFRCYAEKKATKKPISLVLPAPWADVLGKGRTLRKRPFAQRALARPDLSSASMTLQRFGRGFLVRARKRRMRSEFVAGMVWRLQRRLRQIRKSRRENASARRIQHQYRRFRAVQRRRGEMAVRIQKSVRACGCRRRFAAWKESSRRIQRQARCALARRKCRALAVRRQIATEDAVAGRQCFANSLERLKANLFLESMRRRQVRRGVTSELEVLFLSYCWKTGTKLGIAAFVKLLRDAGAVRAGSLTTVQAELIYNRHKEDGFLPFVAFCKALQAVVDAISQKRSSGAGPAEQPEAVQQGKRKGSKWTQPGPAEMRLFRFCDKHLLQNPLVSDKLALLTTEGRDCTTRAWEKAIHASGVLQKLARNWMARQAERSRSIDLALVQQMLQRTRNVLRIQALYRGARARRALRQRLLSVYLRYRDRYTGLSYYFNPHTGHSSWTTPWMLKAARVDIATSIEEPRAERVWKEACDKCGIFSATKFVNDSDAFFCDRCAEHFHRLHPRMTLLDIDVCTLCKYQIGSKYSCDRDALCDTCFFAQHRAGSLKEQAWQAIVPHCQACRSYAARTVCDACDGALLCKACAQQMTTGQVVFHERAATLTGDAEAEAMTRRALDAVNHLINRQESLAKQESSTHRSPLADASVVYGPPDDSWAQGMLAFDEELARGLLTRLSPSPTGDPTRDLVEPVHDRTLARLFGAAPSFSYLFMLFTKLYVGVGNPDAATFAFDPAQHEIRLLDRLLPRQAIEFRRHRRRQVEEGARQRLRRFKHLQLQMRREWNAAVLLQATLRRKFAYTALRAARRQRRKYLQKRQKDEPLRSTLKYRVLSTFGLAPPLESDLPAERILKSWPVWWRDTVRDVVAGEWDRALAEMLRQEDHVRHRTRLGFRGRLMQQVKHAQLRSSHWWCRRLQKRGEQQLVHAQKAYQRAREQDVSEKKKSLLQQAMRRQRLALKGVKQRVKGSEDALRAFTQSIEHWRGPDELRRRIQTDIRSGRRLPLRVKLVNGRAWALPDRDARSMVPIGARLRFASDPGGSAAGKETFYVVPPTRAYCPGLDYFMLAMHKPVRVPAKRWQSLRKSGKSKRKKKDRNGHSATSKPADAARESSSASLGGAVVSWHMPPERLRSLLDPARLVVDAANPPGIRLHRPWRGSTVDLEVFRIPRLPMYHRVFHEAGTALSQCLLWHLLVKLVALICYQGAMSLRDVSTYFDDDSDTTSMLLRESVRLVQAAVAICKYQNQVVVPEEDLVPANPFTVLQQLLEQLARVAQRVSARISASRRLSGMMKAKERADASG